MRVSTVAFLTTLLLAACEGGPGDAASDAVPVMLTASDVHIVGSSESIAEVVDLDVLPDGTVWVLNSAAPFFVGFRPDGQVLGPYGSAGGGPEEFRMPAGFLVGGLRGETWVFDYVRNAFIQVSDPGGAWTRVAVPPEAAPRGSVRGGMNMLTNTVRTFRLGSEIILPRSSGTLESGIFALKMAIMGADLAAFDPESGAAHDIVSLGQVLDDPTVGFERTDGGFPLWYRLWAVCGDSEIHVYDRVHNQLRGFDASGTEIAPVDLPPVPFTEVTPRQFALALFSLRQAEATGAVGPRLSPEDSVRLVNEGAAQLKGTPAQLAAYLPRYVDFRCSGDGTMWLRPLDPDAGDLQGGLGWIRVSPDGSARDVYLPERFDAYRFTSDRVWGVQRDELDVASIAWIGLP